MYITQRIEKISFKKCLFIARLINKNFIVRIFIELFVLLENASHAMCITIAYTLEDNVYTYVWLQLRKRSSYLIRIRDNLIPTERDPAEFSQSNTREIQHLYLTCTFVLIETRTYVCVCYKPTYLREQSVWQYHSLSVTNSLSDCRKKSGKLIFHRKRPFEVNYYIRSRSLR